MENLWSIYDELEELLYCEAAVIEMLFPDSQLNREKLAMLLQRLQRQKVFTMQQLHTALAEPA